jgi:uncharacterized protein YeaO (DUF488 family)
MPRRDELLALIRHEKRATLLFAAKDTEHNNTVVLRALCERRLSHA